MAPFGNFVAVYAKTSAIIQRHSDVYPRQCDPFTEVLTENLRFHVGARAEPHCKDVIGRAEKTTETLAYYMEELNNSPRACVALFTFYAVITHFAA